MAAIFPLRIKTSALVNVPRVTVSTVALRMRVSRGALLRSCANDCGRGMPVISEQISTWIVSRLIIVTLVIKAGTDWRLRFLPRSGEAGKTDF
jgi:hypothetical protein